MKFRSVLRAVLALVVLSVSTAWTAETPKPGKTKEETILNAAILKCKTEHPRIVDAMVNSYVGKSREEVRENCSPNTTKTRPTGFTTLPWSTGEIGLINWAPNCSNKCKPSKKRFQTWIPGSCASRSPTKSS